MRKARRLAMILLTAAGLVAAWLQWDAAPLQTCRAVDGDTIRCGELRVRLVGLDAPEMRGRCAEERQRAIAATERLRALLEGGVRLREMGEDRYGRTLAVARNAEGQDVAAILIREGLARAYDGRGRRGGWCQNDVLPD